MPPIKISGFLFLSFLFFSCSPVQKAGKQFQKNPNIESLSSVVERVSLGIDTAEIKKILGEPDADFGFDYRYLIDSTGPMGCVVGAVFHIDDRGKIDQKWIGEICE